MLIYLIDILGKKSGMDYYLGSFNEYLHKIGLSSEICSNYRINRKQFYPNIYTGNIFYKLLKLLWSYIRYYVKVLFLNKGDYIILLTYGTIVDLGFLFLSIYSKSIIIDVHEVISLDNKSKYITYFYSYLYKRTENIVIYHSDKIKKELIEYGLSNKMLYVPHFKYCYDKTYNIENLKKDIIESVSINSINLLYFGNIRRSKGIYEMFNLVSENSKNQNQDIEINIIIAGQDNEGIIDTLNLKSFVGDKCKLIIRHIADEELNYLFSNTDYILLPYNNISQSGVLETAIYFKKPIITSDIKYFNDLLKEYPSFGNNMKFKASDSYKKLLNILRNAKDYYQEDDLMKYKKNDEYDNFAKNISLHIINSYKNAS